MARAELLSRHEAAALRAVGAGTLARLSATLDKDELGGKNALYSALRRFERCGLVYSRRDAHGRHYRLTPAGRSRLRQARRFEHALLALLARSSSHPE